MTQCTRPPVNFDALPGVGVRIGDEGVSDTYLPGAGRAGGRTRLRRWPPMTREVMGSAPSRTGGGGASVDFDLGELRRAPVTPEQMPREPLTVRLAAWRTHRTNWWRALALGSSSRPVAAFAGWHVGGDRARGEVEAWISANPPLVGWIVDNGPDLASRPGDPREDVELHLLNVGRDPVIVRSMSATSDGAPVEVSLNSYAPTRIPTGGTTIASLVLRTSCTTEYSEAALGGPADPVRPAGRSALVRPDRRRRTDPRPVHVRGARTGSVPTRPETSRTPASTGSRSTRPPAPAAPPSR